MEHIKRTERLGVITYILTSTPNTVHNFSEFCERFSVAKSTVSEDIDFIAAAFSKHGIGMIETIAGAAGGVRFRPISTKESMLSRLDQVAAVLSEPGRLLPGGFLYNSDVSSDTAITSDLGQIIATKYYDRRPDFILTMETKGIPLALMTAKALNVGLVIARRDTKAYEGNAVKINYTSGTENEHLNTMAISRRAVKPGQRTLIVDDFAKGGGTLQGMTEMMSECQVEVLGIETMIRTAQPEVKLCKDFSSLLIMKSTDRMNRTCEVVANEHYFD